MTEEQKSFHWLSSILDTLRRDCPWDKAQTTNTLRYLTIEEVYELSEAVNAGNYDEMRKELGDLFLHLLFYSKIASDEGHFNTVDVIDGICNKLISRHPHIALPDREGVVQPARQSEQPKWEQVKMREGRHSVLEGVPKTLPPLVKAIRMQEKAAGMGFDFPNSEQAKEKFFEEYNEFVEALDSKDADHAEEEFGDLLFALVKWGRHVGINADDALMRANDKFYKRFTYVERCAADFGRPVQSLPLQEMERLWNEAKNID